LLGLAVEFAEFRAEVRAHVSHDLLDPLQMARAEYLMAVSGDENQVGVQDDDTVSASADVIVFSHKAICCVRAAAVQLPS